MRIALEYQRPLGDLHMRFSLFPSETAPDAAIRVGLELAVPLPQPPEHWVIGTRHCVYDLLNV